MTSSSPAGLRSLRVTLALCLPLLTLLGGCPKPDPKAIEPDVKSFEPSVPVPGDNPLTKYDKLWLGMNSIEVASKYNAPDGKGQGFSRVIEDFGAVQNHIIDFNPEKPEKARRMVLRMYRDQLIMLVDRREGLSAAEASAWLAELKKQYGDSPEEIVPGAQWSWGSKDSVLLTYTQDNASPGDMNANVVLEHHPSYLASRAYAEAYELVHPSSSSGAGATQPAAGSGQSPAGDNGQSPSAEGGQTR